MEKLLQLKRNSNFLSLKLIHSQMKNVFKNCNCLSVIYIVVISSYYIFFQKSCFYKTSLHAGQLLYEFVESLEEKIILRFAVKSSQMRILKFQTFRRVVFQYFPYKTDFCRKFEENSKKQFSVSLRELLRNKSEKILSELRKLVWKLSDDEQKNREIRIRKNIHI